MNKHDIIRDIFRFSKDNQGERADTLKRSIMPDSLYRYQSLNEKSLECLSRKSIWLSNYKALNDPFEAIVNYNLERHLKEFFLETKFESKFLSNFGVPLTQDEIMLIRGNPEPYKMYVTLCNKKNIQALKPLPEKQLKKGIFGILEKYREYSYVGCFTEIKDSILMWSHYADNGKGICIDYSLINSDLSWLFPIFYSVEMYEFSIKDLSSLVRNIIKSKDWEYEKEWRIVYVTKSMKENDHYAKIPTPKRILLGPRFEENTNENISKLARIASNLNIPIFRTQLSSTEYKIVVNDNPTNLGEFAT